MRNGRQGSSSVASALTTNEFFPANYANGASGIHTCSSIAKSFFSLSPNAYAPQHSKARILLSAEGTKLRSKTVLTVLAVRTGWPLLPVRSLFERTVSGTDTELGVAGLESSPGVRGMGLTVESDPGPVWAVNGCTMMALTNGMVFRTQASVARPTASDDSRFLRNQSTPHAAELRRRSGSF